MMGQAVLAQFEADFGVGQEAPEKVTYIPLDGEGTVQVRVEKSVYHSPPAMLARGSPLFQVVQSILEST
jgi:hypothetical protein